MLTLLISIAALVTGYFFYGTFMERFFGADDAIKRPHVV